MPASGAWYQEVCQRLSSFMEAAGLGKPAGRRLGFADHYWAQMDPGRDPVAALLPPGVEVGVVADRADAMAPFVARRRARGGHGVIRAKAASELRGRDYRGRERALRHLVAQPL